MSQNNIIYYIKCMKYRVNTRFGFVFLNKLGTGFKEKKWQYGENFKILHSSLNKYLIYIKNICLNYLFCT